MGARIGLRRAAVSGRICRAVHPGRADRSRRRPHPVVKDDGTGASFIVKGSEEGIASTILTSRWEVTYPPTAAQSPAVIAGITARLGRMEALLAARDPALWEELDLDSAVAFVLLQE